MNRFCPHCGTPQASPDSARCTSCGGELPDAPAAPPSPVAQAPYPAPPPYGHPVAPTPYAAPHPYAAPAPYAAPPPHAAQPPYAAPLPQAAPPPYAAPAPYGQTPGPTPYGAPPAFGAQPPFGAPPSFGAQPPPAGAAPGAWSPARTDRTKALALVTIGAALLIVVGSGAFAFHLARRSWSARASASATPSGVPTSSVAGAATPQSAPAAPAAAPPPPPGSTESQPITLTWRGRVQSSTDFTVRPGTPCTLEATFVRTTSGHDSFRKDSLVLRCAAKTLYDASLPLGSGMSNTSLTLAELPVAGEAQAFEYTLKAQDLGTRTGARNQIALSTRDGVAEVSRDLPSLRVKVTLDRYTAVRRGKPFFDDSVPRFTNVIDKRAVVDKRQGPVPFAVSTCSLRISPAFAAKNTCRVKLTCGTKVLLGAGGNGFEACTHDASGQPTGFDDPVFTAQDSDPAMQVDLTAGTAQVSDKTPAGLYTVSFKLL